MSLGLLMTRPELACHTFHNGVVDYVPSQAPGQTGGTRPPPLPYSREIVMARMRLLRSRSSFMICSSCLGEQGAPSFRAPHRLQSTDALGRAGRDSDGRVVGPRPGAAAPAAARVPS